MFLTCICINGFVRLLPSYWGSQAHNALIPAVLVLQSPVPLGHQNYLVFVSVHKFLDSIHLCIVTVIVIVIHSSNKMYH